MVWFQPEKRPVERRKKDEGDAGVEGAIAHAFCISDRI